MKSIFSPLAKKSASSTFHNLKGLTCWIISEFNFYFAKWLTRQKKIASSTFRKLQKMKSPKTKFGKGQGKTSDYFYCFLWNVLKRLWFLIDRYKLTSGAGSLFKLLLIYLFKIFANDQSKLTECLWEGEYKSHQNGPRCSNVLNWWISQNYSFKIHSKLHGNYSRK